MCIVVKENITRHAIKMLCANCATNPKLLLSIWSPCTTTHKTHKTPENESSSSLIIRRTAHRTTASVYPPHAESWQRCGLTHVSSSNIQRTIQTMLRASIYPYMNRHKLTEPWRQHLLDIACTTGCPKRRFFTTQTNRGSVPLSPACWCANSVVKTFCAGCGTT